MWGEMKGAIKRQTQKAALRGQTVIKSHECVMSPVSIMA